MLENGDREPKLSTLVRLAEALRVREQVLIDAYKGQKPDEQSDSCDSSRETLDEIINVLLKKVNHRVFAEALLAYDGPEKVLEYIAEAKRRHAERKKEKNDYS